VLVGSSQARVVHDNPFVNLNLKPWDRKPPKDQTSTFQISGLILTMTQAQFTYFSRASDAS
jgi:hypothetical protein